MTKRHSRKGMHPEDIKAAVRKRGLTLAGLAARHSYSESYLRRTLTRPMFRGEQIIAKFLGISARSIWPDRYESDGTPKHGRVVRKPYGPRSRNPRQSQAGTYA